MSDFPSPTHTDGLPTAANSARPMTRTYMEVLVVEALVLLALWGFRWYFAN